MRECAVFIISLAILIQAISAADITTRSGKVLQNSIVIKADASTITIHHNGKLETFPLSDMPEEIQKLYHYDEKAAALAQKEREIAELKKALAEKTSTPAAPSATPEATPSPAAEEQPSPTPKRKKQAPPPTPSPTPEEKGPTLETIAADYLQDRAAAEAKYRNQRLDITGTVDSISKSLTKPGYFEVFLKSPDPRISFRLHCEFTTAYTGLRDKTGSVQTDFKIDVLDNGSRIAVQRTSKTYSTYYYYYDYNRRRVGSQKDPWTTIIAKGQTVKVQALCTGKTTAVDFTNCEFKDLKLPFFPN
jgi:hypothetical protein